MKLNLKVSGTDDVIKKLQKLQYKETRKELSKALRAGGKITLPDLKGNTPIRTGLLAKSWKLRVAKAKKPYVRFRIVNGDAWYGRFVDEGTKRIAARNLIKSSVARTKGRVVNQVKVDMMQYIRF